MLTESDWFGSFGHFAFAFFVFLAGMGIGAVSFEPEHCRRTSIREVYIPVYEQVPGAVGVHEELSGQCMLVKRTVWEVCDD